ncbi:hypothetical protein ALI144C_18910 [Actinosynnema sp. ALI-1.44]|uniref:DUF5994 family protein n=1 Tax=Actinosynnema sp. ALI-1.44 TaxID=1933779 RepID=UPI00097C776C|nr:DUF5994 family protein [Actinosynnema sp. ALI-1.44]ONI81412.1 hypothetical protein ALI144C_18910 [Actinosynnema sp. ALI-1.44]
MNSDLPTIDQYPAPRRAERELRLKIKPITAARSGVDGAWWPWSTAPAAEFPALIMALSSWVGPVRRLAYRPGDWQPTEPTMTVEGWLVRLEAPHTVAANTVVLVGQDLRELCLVVVPSSTPGGAARAALHSASSSDTVATATDILFSNGVVLDGQSDTACRR